MRGDRCGNEGTGGSMDEEVYPGTRGLVGIRGGIGVGQRCRVAFRDKYAF